MRFEVYYRRITDGRAPERVSLSEDYRRAGIIITENIRRVEHVVATQPEVASKFEGSRRIMVGDVVIDKDRNQALIYTPTGAWATVKVI